MFKREKGRPSLRLFLDALTVIVMVLVILALPYAITEVYGIKVRTLILLFQLVALASISVALLIWWLSRGHQSLSGDASRGRNKREYGST